MVRTGLVISIFLSCSYPDSGFSQENTDCATLACHGTIKTGDVLHAPVEQQCESCHNKSKAKHPASVGAEFTLVEQARKISTFYSLRNRGVEFTLAEQAPDLCYMCHEPKNKKTSIHAPVEDGDCGTCHGPHNSEQPALVILDDSDNLCETCHDLELAGNVVQHGPVISKNCLSCHEVHQSSHPGLLKKASSELCYQCHQEIKEHESLPTIHAAFEDDCLGCHSPHGSQVASLLSTQDPDLCFECHGDLEEAMTKGKTIHKPFVDTKSCLQCHLPHASENASLLVNSSPELCFECHKNTPKTIQPKLEKKFVHAPAADGDCTACHSSHASEFTALLNTEFPEGSYAPGQEKSFGLCFECHDAEMMQVASTISATEFRDGNKNLHFIHLNGDKGRNCNLCHDMHASDNPHLIAEEVLFGNWSMPLKFTSKETGGSCLPGCHEEQEYTR